MAKRSPEKSEPTMEGLKKQKTSLTKEYEKFQDIRKNYLSDTDIAKSLNADAEVFDKVAKDPKYKPFLQKIKELAIDGLIALIKLAGTEIKKDSNLAELKKKLDNLKTRLSSSLQKWYTVHANLDRAVESEKKRLDMANTLTEKAEVESAGKLNAENIERHEDIVNLIKETKEFKELEKKINTASADEITYLAKDKKLFTAIDKKIENIVKAENKRTDLLKYIKSGYATDEAQEIYTMIGANEIKWEKIKTAIENSPSYQDLIDKVQSASTDDMLAIKEEEISKYYSEKFLTIGYQCANKAKIEKQLRTYLALKPKGAAENEYLQALKKSSFYKKAIAAANSEDLSTQKNFDTADYFDYKSEVGETNKDTLYNYAVMVADSLPRNSSTGKVALNHRDENSA